MSGKPEKNNIPETEMPLEEEVPVEETEAEVSKPKGKAKDAPKKAQPAPEPKKKKSGGGFRLSSIDPIILASFTIFMVACLIVTGVTVYGIVVDENNDKTAEYGDKIVVNYTGSYFDYYYNGGTVFDTSVQDVADNADYKKSYEYTEKESLSPLTFTIGDGSYLSEFENALIGHKPGDKIEVSIVDGYGSLDDSNKFSTAKTGIIIDKIRNFTSDDYTKFFGSDAAKSGIVKSPYGWDANVVSNSDGTYTVEYLATADQTYEIETGFAVKATAVSDKITFDYVVDSFDLNAKMFKGVINDKVVYIIGADDTNITYKTCDEKTGITLYFVIEFVKYSES